jgi:hypothetical protein
MAGTDAFAWSVLASVVELAGRRLLATIRHAKCHFRRQTLSVTKALGAPVIEGLGGQPALGIEDFSAAQAKRADGAGAPSAACAEPEVASEVAAVVAEVAGGAGRLGRLPAVF